MQRGAILLGEGSSTSSKRLAVTPLFLTQELGAHLVARNGERHLYFSRLGVG